MIQPDGDVSRTAAVHMAVHNTAQDGCDHGHCVRVPSGVAVALHCVSTGSACGGLRRGLRCSICISCGGVGCCGHVVVACRGMRRPVVAGCCGMSRNVAEMSRRCRGGVARCHKMSQRCRKMSRRCREMSRDVVEMRAEMSRDVARCHKMSPSVPTHLT